MRLLRVSILAICLAPQAGCSWYDVLYATMGSAYGENGNPAMDKLEYDQKIERWKTYEQYGPES
ncbi:MAG: hypothetical protein KDA37_12640 [Planctomycetales bacterium]|nr:hypothetical protein [Planctomycetales bacterium]